MALRDNPRVRRAVSWGVTYTAGLVGAVAVVDYVSKVFGWPGTVSRTIIIILFGGLIGTVFLAWVWPDRDTRISRGQLAALAVIVGLTVAAAIFIGPAKSSSGEPAIEISSGPSVSAKRPPTQAEPSETAESQVPPPKVPAQSKDSSGEPKLGNHLAIFEFADGDERGTGRPDRISLLSMNTYESYATIFSNHEQWQEKLKEARKSDPPDLTLPTFTLSEGECPFHTSLLDLEPSLIPGFLAFVLQSTAGEDGPVVTIKGMKIHADIDSTYSSTAGDEFVVVRADYHPGASSFQVIPTYGVVSLRPGRSVHPVVPATGVDAATGLRPLFRQTLRPGEEGFWAIRIDSLPRSAFVLKVDLEVQYFVVEKDRTSTYTRVFRDVLRRYVLQPELEQVAGVCAADGSGVLTWTQRPALTGSLVWGELWRQLPGNGAH